MAKRTSAGHVIYRCRDGAVEVFLVHPGGPFWAKKDLGAWSIPKGECDPEEDPLEAAKREVAEETGYQISGDVVPLAPIRQRSGKIIRAWAVEGDFDASNITSNTFSMEWPPRSGRHQDFPEIDRAGWFPLDVARDRIVPGQVGFLTELSRLLALHY